MHELRIYPAKFASKLVQLIPKMKRSPPKVHVEVSQDKISQHKCFSCVLTLYPSQLPPADKAIPTATSVKVDMVTPLAELFAAAPAGGDCPEAALGETLNYLKRSQYLALPFEWGQMM